MNDIFLIWVNGCYWLFLKIYLFVFFESVFVVRFLNLFLLLFLEVILILYVVLIVFILISSLGVLNYGVNSLRVIDGRSVISEDIRSDSGKSEENDELYDVILLVLLENNIVIVVN